MSMAFDKLTELDTVLPKEAVFLEIGTCGGDSALETLRVLMNNNSKRWFFTVDPYGDKPYHNPSLILGLKYDEKEYRTAMRKLYDFAISNELNYYHWRLTSDDFMRMYPSVEFWYDRNVLGKTFGYVYLDGEHELSIVKKEFEWFKERVVPGGVIVIDDFSLLGKDAMQHFGDGIIDGNQAVFQL